LEQHFLSGEFAKIHAELPRKPVQDAEIGLSAAKILAHIDK